MMKKTIYYYLLFFVVLTTGCDDLEDKLTTNTVPLNETTELYVLSEGLFNMNNSTLAHYNMKDKAEMVSTNYFKEKNSRGLGDTANDMQMYGSKLYIVVNVSSQIEILDVATGQSIKRIPMFFKDEEGREISRQPRYITFHKGFGYVCSFDGTVAKIDTTSMSIVAYAKVGRHPDGICVQNNKLYVANSGGLDFPNYDHTVSVVDIKRFKEIKKIEVGMNPYQIHGDAYGDVYVVTRGNYGSVKYALHRIDSRTDEVVSTFEDEVLNFVIAGDRAYLYNFDFFKHSAWIKVIDVRTERVIRKEFITDGTQIETPYGIDVNPVNGDVYITNAYSFTTSGDVLCFSKEGKLKFRLKNIGLNPNTTVFINK